MRKRLAVLALLFSTSAFADVYNVKSYYTTSTTTDTDAIEAALAAVPAEGGEVYVPAGSYEITRTLKIKSKTRLRGEGMRTSRLYVAANAPDFDLIENPDPATGNSGIVIEDLELDGGRAATYVASGMIGFGVDLINVSDFTVQRLFVHRFVRDGIHLSGLVAISEGVWGTGSNRGYILDNITSDMGRSFTSGSGTATGSGSGICVTGGTNIVIARNQSRNNRVAGIIIEKNNYRDTLHHVVVSENILTGNSQGCVTFSVGGDPETTAANEAFEITQVTVEGNIMTSCQEGLRLEHTRFYTVAANRMTSLGSVGIHILGNVSIDGTITGNHIYDVGLTPQALFPPYGIFFRNAQQRVTVTGNNIQGISGRMNRAIEAGTATNLLIVGNIARGATDPTPINAPSATNLVSTNKTN